MISDFVIVVVIVFEQGSGVSRVSRSSAATWWRS